MWMHAWKYLKYPGSFTLKILVNPLHGQHDCCVFSSWVGVVSNISFRFQCTSKSPLPVGTRHHPDSQRDEVWVEVIISLLCDFLFFSICLEWSSKPQIFLQASYLPLTCCRKFWKFILITLYPCPSHFLPSLTAASDLLSAVCFFMETRLEFQARTHVIQ